MLASSLLFAISPCIANEPIHGNSWILKKKYSIASIFNAIDKVEKTNQLDFRSACNYIVLLKMDEEQYQPITPLPNGFLEDGNGHTSLVHFLSEGDITIYLGKSGKANCQDAWFNLKNKDLSPTEALFFVHEYFHFVHQGSAVKSNLSRSRDWRPTGSKFISEAEKFNEGIYLIFRDQRDNAGEKTKFCSLISDWNALANGINHNDFAYWNSMMQGFEWPADYFSWQVLNELGLSEATFLGLVEEIDTLSYEYGSRSGPDRGSKDQQWTTVDLFPNQYLLASLIATTSSYTLKQNQTLEEQMAPYSVLCDSSHRL